jgi:cbb3-type cytochrome oxidase maturation protein
MNIMLVLIPISLLLIAAAIYAFFWAVDHDQFEQLDRAARSPLEDDPQPNSESSSTSAPVAPVDHA